MYIFAFVLSITITALFIYYGLVISYIIGALDINGLNIKLADRIEMRPGTKPIGAEELADTKKLVGVEGLTNIEELAGIKELVDIKEPVGIEEFVIICNKYEY